MKSIIAVGLLTAGVSLANAGSLQNAWELGPYFGRSWMDDYGTAAADDGDIIGGRLGYFFTDRVSLEGSYQRNFSSTGAGNDLNTDSIRLNALYHLTSGTRVRPFFTVGSGWERTTASTIGLKDNDVGVNAGGGIKFIFADKVGLRVDGRYSTLKINSAGVTDSWQHNYEVLAGISWFFGAEKMEPVVVDSDNDGVADAQDKCPGTAAGTQVDSTGCPIDEDGDGVVNSADKCPGTGAGVKVDADGCEIKPTVDSDGDGVGDDEDKCPGTAAGTQVDKTGCPADEDNDGVLNEQDKCAKTPAGVKVDTEGCPEEVKKVRGKLEGVNFKTNSATLLPESEKVLDDAAKILNQVPEAKIEVQGHTDSIGDDNYNMSLSEKRAKSVKDYLIKHGVSAERLSSHGYGETMPVADNKTKEGRALNRRVELKWADQQ